jgi:prophage DNA circulation protein
VVRLVDLHPASFRGARFLVPSDTVDQGPNVVLHKYPDANSHYAEYNGQHPNEYHITAYLHGNNLLGQYRALESALNFPGPGTLNHPWHGVRFCAVKGPYKTHREDRDSGVMKIDITFVVTGPAMFPGDFGAIAALVSGLAASVTASLFDQFVADFGNPLLPPVSLDAVTKAIKDVAGAFAAPMAAVEAVGAASESLLVDGFRLVANSEVLGRETMAMFRGVFDDVRRTYEPEQIRSALIDAHDMVFAVETEALSIPVSTVDYVARRNAILTYTGFCRSVVLASMCETLVAETYSNATAVADAEALLMRLLAEIPADTMAHDVGQELAKVVNAAMGVLRKLELQLPRVETIRTVEMPASVLSYLLYDTDERTQTLIGLNDGSNPLMFDKNVAVLSEV